MYRLVYEIHSADSGPLALTVSAVVFLCWFVGFALVAAHAFNTKSYGAPVVAAALLAAYEVCFLFVWPLDIGWSGAAGMASGLLAILLLTQSVLYAGSTMAERAFRDNALTVVLWAFCASLALLWAVVHYFRLTDGLLPGVFLITAIAALYPAFALLQPAAEHVSRMGQGFRILGDIFFATAVWVWVPFVGATTIADVQSLNCVLVDVLLFITLFSDLVLLTFLYAPRK
jgi:hypothetical protein